MKKALSLLLAFVMVLSLVPMTVFAAAAPTIYFETNFTEDMTVGDTFYVTANLKDNVVFSTMTLSLKWNESAISFTGFNVDRRGGLDTEVYTYSALSPVPTTLVMIRTAGSSPPILRSSPKREI